MLDCFKSTGKNVVEERIATPFSNIDLGDNVDLLIRPDTTFYIRVTAGDNLINGIITEIENTTLYIRNENKCNWMRSFSNKYTVEVGMDTPVKIYYDGSGDIHCLDTIRTPEFFFDCYNGSGSIHFLFASDVVHLNNHIGRTDIHASGHVRQSSVYINDVGTYDGSNLASANAYIRSRTTGACRIKTMQEFGYEILYTGNIYYSGNPVIYNQLITGSGELIHF